VLRELLQLRLSMIWARRLASAIALSVISVLEWVEYPVTKCTTSPLRRVVR